MSSSAARRARRAASRRKVVRRVGVPAEPVKGAVRPRITPGQAACLRMQWRSFIESMNDTTPVRWYGDTPYWRVALEASARRVYSDRLQVIEWPGVLEYRIALDVRGPNDLIDVAVRFYDDPPYERYGLAPQDYPRVFAELGMPSKHRMPDDDALCLYDPADSLWRRWTADKGLLDLLDLVVDHLGYEAYWRATGGPDGGTWLGDEAEHGFEERAAA